jgi:hypothetical protein
MTKDFALTAALGAIELHLLHHVPGCVYLESVVPVIRAALAQAEQEPVAWMDGSGNVFIKYPGDDYVPPYTPLYSSPKREWVGLTFAEVNEIEQDGEFWEDHTPIDFANAIEAKLKELNHD